MKKVDKRFRNFKFSWSYTFYKKRPGFKDLKSVLQCTHEVNPINYYDETLRSYYHRKILFENSKEIISCSFLQPYIKFGNISAPYLSVVLMRWDFGVVAGDKNLGTYEMLVKCSSKSWTF